MKTCMKEWMTGMSSWIIYCLHIVPVDVILLLEFYISHHDLFTSTVA